jgi:hypothetical protein
MESAMKLHIENINITITDQQQPAGLIASLAIAGAAKSSINTEVPNIGEKWPGTEALYAGVSLSKDGDRLVHLILWLNEPDKGLPHDKAILWAESVNPAMCSHIPTRHQSITLFERLQDQFNQDYWHWTLTKTKSGKAAFYQYVDDGYQGLDDLSAEFRVRAVSEIPL